MKQIFIHSILILLFSVSTFSYSDYVEVRRSAKIKETPQSKGTVLLRPTVGQTFVLLGNGQQTRGYYRISIPEGLGTSASEGWIYRTLVKRHQGLAPSGQSPNDTIVPSAPSSPPEQKVVRWPLRNDSSPEPHTIFGIPTYIGHKEGDNILRKYSGFTVYWDDVVLGPRWTSIKLSSVMIDAHGDVDRESRFSPDPFLKDKGLVSTTHNDYKNKPGSRKWARGHIVQVDDARGWGEKSGEESFYTTNIVPQIQSHNGKKWLDLEKACSEFARDYGLAWVYCGPIYAMDPKPFIANRRVPAPIALYKIAVAPGANGSIAALAFIMPHREIDKSVSLSSFLVTIDSIEEATGIDFLHELPDVVEEPLEGTVWGMLPDLPN